MIRLKLDPDYLLEMLAKLLAIPSPCGFTDRIVHFVGEELEALGIDFELTRRGAIRANLRGERSSPDRALVAHLDTLGAMVRELKPNGRLAVSPIGTWSSRFAEGGRVTIFSEGAEHRGTVLPMLASGHAFGDRIDDQPSRWDCVELRVDELVSDDGDLAELGIRIGDVVAFDAGTEVLRNGFVASRHLDDKGGVACILAAARAIAREKCVLPVDCHLLFTISEEVGSGASAVLHRDVAELVAVDNATNAPGHNSTETGVTIAMMDSTGPFDYHLTQKLLQICREHDVPHARDVFDHYRCDAASAIEAGNDIRTALVCFAVDASHGYERTHIRSLLSLADLLALYVQSPPTFQRDRLELGPLEGFPMQDREFERLTGDEEESGGEPER